MKLKPSHPPLRLPSLGLDKLNLAAAALILWVAVGPWIWGYASSSSAVASHVFFIFAFGPLTLLLLVLRPAALILLAAGLWLAASPWLLGYATNHTAWLSDLVTGLLLTAVAGRAAGISIPRLARKHRGATAAPGPTQAAGSRP
jgi:SPW repeat